MSSPEQPRKEKEKMKKKSSKQPRTAPKKEAWTSEKKAVKVIPSSSSELAPEALPGKDESSLSSSPLPKPGMAHSSSSPEQVYIHIPERHVAAVSSFPRQSRRHRSRKEALFKHIPDKGRTTRINLPDPLSGDYETSPQDPPQDEAPMKIEEERSSSPGEACALLPEQYREIAERARAAELARGSPIPSTSYDFELEPSSSSPEQPPRHRYEREMKSQRDGMEGQKKPRERRGRRESLRTVMARKKKELKDNTEKTEDLVLDPYSNSTASNYITKGRTGIVYDAEVLKHHCEWDDEHPEDPQRLSTIMAKCYERGLLAKCLNIPNYLRTDLYDRILTKHSAEHYERLKAICQLATVEELENEASGYDSVYFNKYTFDAACRALSSVLNLVMAVAQRDVMNGMAFVRPPGHHAMFNEFNGYCFFNNVAIAAEACIKEKYSKRVMIIDIDIHHGQGTQQMFYERKDVLYFSMHRYEHGYFWPNLAESNFNYIGKGEGLGYNINVPLNATGLCDDDYLAIVFYLLLPVAYEFNPDLIILSAGYDAAIGCPEGRMHVTPGFYSHLLGLLHGLARGQIAVVLEGGYFIPTLSEAACLTLKTLIGGPCPILDPFRSVHPTVVETIRNVRRMLFGKWKCFNTCEFITPKKTDNEENVLNIQYFGQTEDPPYLTRECYPENTVPEHNYYLKMNKALRERYRASVHLPITYVYDEDMLTHTPQRGDVERPERPERLTSILENFEKFGIDKRLVRTNIVKHDWAVYSPHGPDYMDTIRVGLMQCKDLYVNEHTHDAVMVAVSGLLTILDGVMSGTSRGGVAVIRPPGHHAEHNRPIGFCFVNNVAVAANYLQMKYNMQRILIVDFDIHHGNGTQNMFYSDSRVMYISIHKDEKGKFFPPQSPRSYKHDGHGAGKGFNINIPFNKDKMGDTEYIAAFQNIVLPAAYSFAPQVVLVSAGFDAGIYDPLGGYGVNPETFGHLILMLKPLAEGRVVLALEGGYNLTTTGYAMAISAKALLGDPIIMPKEIYQNFSDCAVQTIRDVTGHFKKYYDIFKVNKKLPNKAMVIKRVDQFTEEMYTRELTRAIDPLRIDDNAFVENEMRILNSTLH